jgi:hypothetical protein
MFYQCLSLQRGAMSGTAYTISYESCRLSRVALVEIFNNLATVVGQTLTYTGNWGTSTITASDKLIATAKGWTLVPA